jgi:hypothetical protein
MDIEKIMTEVYGQRMVRVAKILCRENGIPAVTQYLDWEHHNWTRFISSAMIDLEKEKRNDLCS